MTATKWEDFQTYDLEDAAYGTRQIAQTFKVGDLPHSVTQVYLRGFYQGDAGECRVGIYSLDGEGKPDTELTYGLFDALDFPEGVPFNNDGDWVALDVASLDLEANTSYAVVVSAPSGDGSHMLWLWLNTGGGYDDGRRAVSTDSGTTWVLGNSDMVFQIWGEVGQQLEADPLKLRLLIEAGTDTYDDELDLALEEAKRYVTKVINKYDEDFEASHILTDTMLGDAAYDIAAGIFKRRHMPQDLDQGWWGQGIKKLTEYIQGTYKVGSVFFVGID